MSIQKVAEYFFPAGNFAQIRANAPDRATYNIESTRDLVKNQPLLMTPFAPVGAAAMSIPYDLVQASMRARDTFFKDNPTAFGIVDDAEVPIGPSLPEFASAVAAENPIDSLIERTQGATLGLADRVARAPEFLSNLIFTPVGADSDIVPTKPEDDLMNYNEFYDMPEEKKRESLLSKILELGKGLGGGIVDAAKGAGNVLSNLGIVGALRNLDQFKYLSPADQQFILQQAGGNRPMQDKYGKNIRSAFGNYAQLVKDRAKLADFRKSIGKPIRAIDQYYLNKEKERQAALQKQIQESIQRESGADSYTSQAMAHESKVGRDSGERMGRI